MKKIMFMVIVSMFFSLFANDGEKEFYKEMGSILEEKGIAYEFLTEEEVAELSKDTFVQEMTEDEFLDSLDGVTQKGTRSYTGLIDLVCKDPVSWNSSNHNWYFWCDAAYLGNISGATLTVTDTDTNHTELWDGEMPMTSLYVSDYLYQNGHNSGTNYFLASARAYVLNRIWTGWFWAYIKVPVGNTETYHMRHY